MIKRILTTLLYLGASFSAIAAGPHMNAHELAETRLLAEWVGVPEKQFVLGNVYYNGEGVPRDFTEAAKWFRKAAIQDHAESQYMLGFMRDNGDGMPLDYMEAVEWYRKAAENGHVAAQFELGKKYADGQGVPQNYVEAYVWFNLAAASGLDAAVIERDQVARNLSGKEISEAQRRSTQLFEQFQQRKREG